MARVLRRLGADCLAAYPRGAPAAPWPNCWRKRRPQHLIDIEGETRESFSVVDQRSGEEFRFVLPGPNRHNGNGEVL